MIILVLILSLMLVGCQDKTNTNVSGEDISISGEQKEPYVEKDSAIQGWDSSLQNYSKEEIDGYIAEHFNTLAKNKIDDKIANTHKLVIVYLSNTCKYCKYLLTILPKIEEAYNDTEFYIVYYNHFVSYYYEEKEITGIPRVVIYVDGEEKAKFGFKPEITDFIREFAPID